MNMIENTVFLNSYIYSNGMLFLTIILIHLIETTQNSTIIWYMYYYQFVTFLTILKIIASFMIFWNVFIHFHGQRSVKCRTNRRNFWNRTIITIIQKIQYFSIHIWLKLSYSGLYNAHWCIMRTPSWPWKSPEENYFVSIMRMDF